MSEEKSNLYEEQKKLVLARLNSLNPEAKVMSGKGKLISVRDIINLVERDDPDGKNIIKAQIKMLQVLVRV